MSQTGFSTSLFLAFTFAATLVSTSFGQDERARHFSYIYHDSMTVENTAHLAKALGENYNRVCKNLGVESLPIITVQIWSDEENYQQAMEKTLGSRFPGSRGYITGDREIRLLYHRRLSAQQEAVHEFVHVVTLNINPQFGNNPRWLWEAVAQYEAGQFIHPKDIRYLREGKFPSLELLSGPFNRGGNIYDVGYLLVEYIVESWGRTTLLDLIKSNGNLQKVLELSDDAFQNGWRTFVEEKYLGENKK